MSSLTLLEQRKIEANIIIPFLKALQSRFGEATVHDVVRSVIDEIAFKNGREMAARAEGSPIDVLASILPTFREGDAMEMEMLHRGPDSLDFNVTRCRYAEFYKEMGVPDLGLMLSCNRDYGLARGISKDLELNRAQTIMEGAVYCDFRYVLKRP